MLCVVSCVLANKPSFFFRACLSRLVSFTSTLSHGEGTVARGRIRCSLTAFYLVSARHHAGHFCGWASWLGVRERLGPRDLALRLIYRSRVASCHRFYPDF